MNRDVFFQTWDAAVAQYVEALREARATDRTLKQRFAQSYQTHKASGLGVEDAKQSVFLDSAYQAAWAAADAAGIEEKAARLALDALQLRFEVWRTETSYKKAEMQLH